LPLVLDTGILVALLDADDRHHDRCVALLDASDDEPAVPVGTLAEIDYHLRKRRLLAGWTALVDDIDRGAYRLVALDQVDLSRAAQLEVQYADLGLGFVDASVVATCERLGETKLATLDRRHFSVVRPRHCEALTLLPA